jgi:hypothetical protein
MVLLGLFSLRYTRAINIKDFANKNICIKSNYSGKYFRMANIEDMWRLKVDGQNKHDYKAVINTLTVEDNNKTYLILTSEVTNLKNLQSCADERYCTKHEVRFFQKKTAPAEQWEIEGDNLQSCYLKNRATGTYLVEGANKIATTEPATREKASISIEILPTRTIDLTKLVGKHIRLKSNKIQKYVSANFNKDKKAWIGIVQTKDPDYMYTVFKVISKKIGRTEEYIGLISDVSGTALSIPNKMGSQVSEIRFSTEDFVPKTQWNLIGYSKTSCFFRNMETNKYLSLDSNGNLTAQITQKGADNEFTIEVVPEQKIDLSKLNNKYIRIKSNKTNKFYQAKFDSPSELWLVSCDSSITTSNNNVFRIKTTDNKTIQLASDVFDDNLMQSYVESNNVICENKTVKTESTWKIEGFSNYQKEGDEPSHCYLKNISTQKYLAPKIGNLATASFQAKNEASEITIEIIPDTTISYENLKYIKLKSNYLNRSMAYNQEKGEIKTYETGMPQKSLAFKATKVTEEGKNFLTIATEVDGKKLGVEKDKIGFFNKATGATTLWEFLGHSIDRLYLKNKSTGKYLAFEQTGTPILLDAQSVELSRDKRAELSFDKFSSYGIKVQDLDGKYIHIKSNHLEKYFNARSVLGAWRPIADSDTPNLNAGLFKVSVVPGTNYIKLKSETANESNLQSCGKSYRCTKHETRFYRFPQKRFRRRFSKWYEWELGGVSLNSCYLKNRSTGGFFTPDETGIANTSNKEQLETTELTIDIVNEKKFKPEERVTKENLKKFHKQYVYLKSNALNKYLSAKNIGRKWVLQADTDKEGLDYFKNAFRVHTSKDKLAFKSYRAGGRYLESCSNPRRCSKGEARFSGRRVRGWHKWQAKGFSLKSLYLKNVKTKGYLAPGKMGLVSSDFTKENIAELSISLATPKPFDTDPEKAKEKIGELVGKTIQIKSILTGKYLRTDKGKLYADGEKQDIWTKFIVKKAKNVGKTKAIGIVREQAPKKYLQSRRATRRKKRKREILFKAKRFRRLSQWRVEGFDLKHCYLKNVSTNKYLRVKSKTDPKALISSKPYGSRRRSEEAEFSIETITA